MAETASLPRQASTPLSRAPGVSGPWILGPWRDAVLFIGTPLLILPLVLLVGRGVRVEDMALFVASFGALGHHLPGMIRAYGDRDLFERYRVRFVLAPIFLVLVCALCAWRELAGLTLVLYLWGLWHGLAQTYGFLRIYDAKVQSSAALTCRLDMAMCVAWFLGGVALSPTRSRKVLDLFYSSGGPLVPSAWVEGVRAGAGWVVGAVTLAFLVNLLVGWKRGRPQSPLKLVLMVTSFGFWWYSNVHVSNLLLGILLFEIFHDVQYLSIVWAFNLGRAAKGAELGRISRFLFRPGAALAGAYVGLVFGYGTLNYVARGIPEGTVQRVLTGLLAASALLHFYYDGFIWKVRDKSTRQSLGLAGGKEQGGRPAWITHGAKWLLFAAPLGGLGLAQARGVVADVDRSRSLAETIGRPEDHFQLGRALLLAGEPERAAESFRRGLAEVPADGAALAGLGDALFALGRREEAEQAYRAAVEASDEAAAHNGLGNVLALRGDPRGALTEYREALERAPELATARANLANALAATGQWEEALEHQRWLLAEASDALERAAFGRSLATSLAALGRVQEAEAVLREGLSAAPEEAETHYALADLLGASGRHEEALAGYREALRLRPDHAGAHYGLGNMQALLGRVDEALASYQTALRYDPGLVEARVNRAVLLLHLGRLAEAEADLRAALEADPGYAAPHQHLAELLRRRGEPEEAARHEAIARRLASGAR